jgi:hypothetical protein
LLGLTHHVIWYAVITFWAISFARLFVIPMCVGSVIRLRAISDAAGGSRAFLDRIYRIIRIIIHRRRKVRRVFLWDADLRKFTRIQGKVGQANLVNIDIT